MSRGGKPVRITTQAVERNIASQREVEVRRQDLAAFGRENANLLSAASAQTKIELQRRLTQQQVCRAEQQYEETLKNREFENSFKELTLAQNQALASELDKDIADEERRIREIQKICEEAPELKELEKALQIAYLNKERAAQYEEKILLATREQERIQAIEDQMEYERVRAIRSESDKDTKKKALYDQQRAILQKQIDEKHEQLREAKIQMERERDAVDEIILRINEEDEMDYRKKKEQQEATAKMVRLFEEQRKRERAAAAAAAKAEEDRIIEYNRIMESRNEGVAARKQAKKDEEDRLLQKIVEETERKRKEEEEFNHLRDLLWEEELEAKRAKDTDDRRLKQTRMRQEMMDANANMMEEKKALRLKEMEREAKMMQVMRQKFAEDEARERRAEEARKAGKQHHMGLIAKQKDERKAMYDMERDAEAAFIRANNEKEEYRKRVIQEARKRLLQEHAERLAGYLPSKAFATDEEREAFYRAASHN